MKQTKIVVLDGYTLNPGDLNWDGLRRLGECTVHDRTPAEQVVGRAQGASIVLTNKALLPGEVINALPDLGYIGVLATGYNVVDIAAARKRGIPVTNVPGYATGAVVQSVFAHLLNLTLRVSDHGRLVRGGEWSTCPDFSFQKYPLVDLGGLTMGIVGYGEIGRSVGRVAQALGMRVIVHTRTPKELTGAEPATLEQLLTESDVVTLHCPLTPDTKHLINAARLRLMKPTAYLINTSRGPVIDEAALAEALNRQQIAGAGLDVLSAEPPALDNPLLGAQNCVITPHHAWATGAARSRLMQIAIENVEAFLRGLPQNVVNE